MAKSFLQTYPKEVKDNFDFLPTWLLNYEMRAKRLLRELKEHLESLGGECRFRHLLYVWVPEIDITYGPVIAPGLTILR